MKKLTAVLLALSILVVFSGYALAWSPQFQGQPEQFRPGDTRGVFIWQDRDGIHLRTTTRGQEHAFSGVIRTDGRFVDVRGVREEGKDSHSLSRDRDMIKFFFRTGGGMDGLDFRVREGEKVTFNLYMDGYLIDPQEIFIGHRSWHPGQGGFTLYR